MLAKCRSSLLTGVPGRTSFLLTQQIYRHQINSPQSLLHCATHLLKTLSRFSTAHKKKPKLLSPGLKIYAQSLYLNHCPLWSNKPLWALFLRGSPEALISQSLLVLCLVLSSPFTHSSFIYSLIHYFNKYLLRLHVGVLSCIRFYPYSR